MTPDPETLARLPQFDRHAIIRELVARGGLHEFGRLFWPVVEPSVAFRDNWHIGAICEFLEAVYRGQIKRGVINVPPRTGKSKWTSVLWPAWIWAQDPGQRFICASFDQNLVQRDASSHLALTQHADYAAVYPHVKLASRAPAIRDFSTTRGGFRFSTSVEGKLVGRHAHVAICDDLMKPIDATMNRKSAFERIDQWFNGTLPTRAVDPANFRILVIMQRLHTDDVAGKCIASGWDNLILPMRQVRRSMWARDPRKEVGELLWPEVYPEETVRNLEVTLRAEASAQLQQDPTPMSGGIIDEAWTRLEWIEVPKRATFVQSWDFSAKGTKESHSKVSGALWAVSRDVKMLRELLSTLDDRLAKVPGAQGDARIVTVPERAELFLLIDRVTGHWNFPRSKAEFLAAQNRPHWHRARVKLLEEKANGAAIIEELRGKVPGIKPVSPKDSKEERLRVHSDKFEAGQVVFPPGAVGDEVREQLVKFPRFTWDDDVDTTTQALDRLASRSERYRENLRVIAGRGSRS